MRKGLLREERILWATRGILGVVKGLSEATSLVLRDIPEGTIVGGVLGVLMGLY